MAQQDTYVPQPVDTSDVQLPAALMELVEAMARNVHAVWAQGRLAQGWTYGRRRDDQRKQHPGLVDYDRLTEAEKDYDRRTCLATLKLIMKMGFKIEKL